MHLAHAGQVDLESRGRARLTLAVKHRKAAMADDSLDAPLRETMDSLLASHQAQVVVDGRLGRIAHDHGPAAQEDHPLAQGVDDAEIVGDEYDGLAFFAKLANAFPALSLKILVAHREHFVDKEDVGVGVDRDGKTKADEHPARIRLDRIVDELFDAREFDDPVKHPRDARGRHAEDATVEVDVLASGQQGMESRTEFQQRCHLAIDVHPAPGGRGDPGQDFQQGALARAVGADDTDRLAALDGEGDIAEGVELRRLLAANPVRDAATTDKHATSPLRGE